MPGGGVATPPQGAAGAAGGAAAPAQGPGTGPAGQGPPAGGTAAPPAHWPAGGCAAAPDHWPPGAAAAPAATPFCSGAGAVAGAGVPGRVRACTILGLVLAGSSRPTPWRFSSALIDS